MQFFLKLDGVSIASFSEQNTVLYFVYVSVLPLNEENTLVAMYKTPI